MAFVSAWIASHFGTEIVTENAGTVNIATETLSGAWVVSDTGTVTDHQGTASVSVVETEQGLGCGAILTEQWFAGDTFGSRTVEFSFFENFNGETGTVLLDETVSNGVVTQDTWLDHTFEGGFESIHSHNSWLVGQNPMSDSDYYA